MWKIILVLSLLSVVIYGQQGLTDIDIKSDGFTSQYSFTIDYENVGSGGINNLELKEILQVGWSLNTNLSTPGWSCGESLCTFSLPSVAPLSSGSILFVVNVDQSSQVNGNGTKKCWENIVSSTFTDEDYDPTPNNNQASVKIGSSCSTCCDPAPCPINTCQLTCPPQNITAPCPEVGCNCKVPEYYCPPCKKEENNCASTCGMPEVDACSSVNCDDGNLCTADSCSGGNCTHTPISCNDGNACTTDTCNPSTGCIRTSISCDDGNLCTTDSCSGGNCTHSPISCDDGNACTIDTCNPTTGCVHTERNCSSNDFCQINGRCDRATGTCISDPRTCTGSNLCAQSAFCNSTARACQDVPKVCTNNACYTNGACNITTGACDYTRTTCNDNNSCTNNRCDNTTGCYFPPVVCSDNNTCSVDYCSPTTGTCIFTFYCSNTDECFNRVCTNECPSSGECTGDPSTTAALSASVINQRLALNCKVTPTGLPNCGKK